MPKAKPLILLFCWLTVAIVTGFAIGLYPAFNIKLEPLNDIKELHCQAVITKELELIDESEQVHAGLGFEDNNQPTLYISSIPDGSMFYCSPNEITIQNDKIMYMVVANNNEGGGAYGLSLITLDDNPIVNAAIIVNSKGDVFFGLYEENMSLVSVVDLVSNDPAMEILKTKDPKQLLSINYKPPTGSGIYLDYPDQVIRFPNKNDNATKPSSIFQPLLGK